MPAHLYYRDIRADEFDQDPPEVDTAEPGKTNSFGGPLPPAIERRMLLHPLHTREVLPDEADVDPAMPAPGVVQLLQAFTDAVRNGHADVAQMLAISMAADGDVMGEIFIAAAYYCGIELDQ